MSEHQEHRKLSAFFKELQQLCDKEDLYFKELIEKISERGHSVLIFFLSLPFITPAPTFGVSAIFGLAISYVAVQMIMGRAPWVPEKITQKKVPRDTFKKIFSFIVKVLEKIEYLVKPRLPKLFENKILRVILASEAAILGILLALPLPPGTNAPPASGIALIGLAISEKDSLMLIISQLIFIFNLVLFGMLAFLGVEGTKFLLEKLW